MSAYETWVLRLHRWVDDPTGTPLDDLPPLDADGYNRETMNRFVDHFRGAREESMRRWSQALERNVGGSRTPAELQTALVRMRGGLSRQLQLVRHRGLPDELRRIFTEDMERSIERLQEQLEESITRNTSATTSNRALLDQLLRVVREAPLTAAIGMRTTDASTARPAPGPLDRPDPAAFPPAAAPRRHRMVPVPPREGS